MKEYLAPDMLSLSIKRETAEALQAALKEALQ